MTTSSQRTAATADSARNVDRHDHRTDDDDDVEERQRRPDLDAALAEDVDAPAEVAETGADGDASRLPTR
jgi:hypothetical protein